jgi:uridine kinase
VTREPPEAGTRQPPKAGVSQSPKLDGAAEPELGSTVRAAEGPHWESFGALAARILDAPARLGGVRLVAVDGGTGSGKTTFAGRLQKALRERCSVRVLHTDDLLDGWDDQFTFWPRLVGSVFEPLAHGRAASYPVYDWYAQAFTSQRPLPVPDVLIVEGVSSARAAGDGVRTLEVFMDLEPAARLRRALDRDHGLGVDERLRRWVEREIEWYAADRTAQRAAVVVDAVADVGHHPEREFVRREVGHGG